MEQEQEEDAEVEGVVVEEGDVEEGEEGGVEGLDYTECEQYINKNENINLISFLDDGVSTFPCQTIHNQRSKLRTKSAKWIPSPFNRAIFSVSIHFGTVVLGHFQVTPFMSPGHVFYNYH